MYFYDRLRNLSPVILLSLLLAGCAGQEKMKSGSLTFENGDTFECSEGILFHCAAGPFFIGSRCGITCYQKYGFESSFHLEKIVSISAKNR